MKKNSFIEGTIAASIAIILVKILGALYVIPFYKIIGEQGGTLYSYAYNIYNLFLTISITGFPIAMSKIISEYNEKKQDLAKEKTYKIGNQIIGLVAIISFLVLFAFAEQIASLILGDVSGFNTIQDIAFVVRIISFSLLIIPFLSITRGYLQGHKYINISSNSQIIEQVIRIFVVLIGSYLVIKVFNQTITLGVGIALTGAFIGGIITYAYLRIKIKNNKKDFQNEDPDNTIIESKEIIKKFINYSIPLIIISVISSLYDTADMILVLRGANLIGYSASDSELLSSITSTWAPKICVIINAIAVAISINIMPNLMESVVKKDYKSLNEKFIKSIQSILFLSIPMAIGISLLATPVYTLFYDQSIYGPMVLKVMVLSVIFVNLHTVVNTALNGINKYKIIYLNTIIGTIIKIILDIPLMIIFDKLGLFPVWGTSLATVIAYSVSFIIIFTMLKKEFDFKYKDIITTLKKMILPVLLMTLPLIIINQFIDFSNLSNFQNLIIIILYATIGASIYIYLSYKNGLLYEILGKDYINSILKKFKLNSKTN